MDTKIKRGQILRQLRLARQLTQNEAAENFGISQQTYQKYESGKTEPPYDLLCDFATFYGVSTDYLLGRTPVKQMMTEEPDVLSQLAQIFNLSEFEKVIVQAFIAISPEERGKFIETIAKFAQKEETTQQITEQPIVQSKPQIQQQPVVTAPLPKPDIQASSMMNSDFAVARGGSGFRPAPTDEQFESFIECMPDMLGE